MSELQIVSHGQHSVMATLSFWNCITVTWWSGSGGIQARSRRPTVFFHCFDTVGLVVWPVEIVPEMTYNVLSGTLSLYTTTTHRVSVIQRVVYMAWLNMPQ